MISLPVARRLRRAWCPVVFALAVVVPGCGSRVTEPEPPGPSRWVPTSGPRVQQITCLVASGTRQFAGTSSGVCRSLDGGETWELDRIGLSNQYVTALLIRGNVLFAGTFGDGRGYYRGLYYTSDAGDNWWQRLPDYFVSALACNDTTVFVGTLDAGVFRLSENGPGWTNETSGLPVKGILSLVFSGGDLFAGTDGGGVFRSSDNGAHWDVANQGLTSLVVRDLVAIGPLVFAGTREGVFRSVDAGETWSAMSQGMAGANVLDLAAGPAGLFASTAGGGVFHSPDGGSSWTAINDGLPDHFVPAIAVSRANLLAGLPQSCVWHYALE